MRREARRFICTANLQNHCGVRRISRDLPGRGASRTCAAAQKRIQRRCRKAMHAEHADASVRLQDRRSRIRYRRARVAGIESQMERRRSPHPPVLRASPCCICYEILALRCREPVLAHALAGRRRRTRFWRYTLARRMYGAPFWLRPTAALRALRASPFGICAEILPWPASPAQSLIPRVITAAIGTAIPSAVRNSAAFASMSAMMAGIAAGF